MKAYVPTQREIDACRRKVFYDSEVSARMGAQAAITIHHKSDRMWVYGCGNCQGWHVTSSFSGVDANTIAVTAKELWEGKS